MELALLVEQLYKVYKPINSNNADRTDYLLNPTKFFLPEPLNHNNLVFLNTHYTNPNPNVPATLNVNSTLPSNTVKLFTPVELTRYGNVLHEQAYRPPINCQYSNNWNYEQPHDPTNLFNRPQTTLNVHATPQQPQQNYQQQQLVEQNETQVQKHLKIRAHNLQNRNITKRQYLHNFANEQQAQQMQQNGQQQPQQNSQQPQHWQPQNSQQPQNWPQQNNPQSWQRQNNQQQMNSNYQHSNDQQQSNFNYQQSNTRQVLSPFYTEPPNSSQQQLSTNLTNPFNSQSSNYYQQQLNLQQQSNNQHSFENQTVSSRQNETNYQNSINETYNLNNSSENPNNNNNNNNNLIPSTIQEQNSNVNNMQNYDFTQSILRKLQPNVVLHPNVVSQPNIEMYPNVPGLPPSGRRSSTTRTNQVSTGDMLKQRQKQYQLSKVGKRIKKFQNLAEKNRFAASNTNIELLAPQTQKQVVRTSITSDSSEQSDLSEQSDTLSSTLPGPPYPIPTQTTSITPTTPTTPPLPPYPTPTTTQVQLFNPVPGPSTAPLPGPLTTPQIQQSVGLPPPPPPLPTTKQLEDASQSRSTTLDDNTSNTNTTEVTVNTPINLSEDEGSPAPTANEIKSGLANLKKTGINLFN